MSQPFECVSRRPAPHHAVPRRALPDRRVAAAAVCALLVAGACADGATAPGRAPRSPRAAAIDFSSTGCVIGKVGPLDAPEWFGAAVPASDTSCGRRWTMRTPPLVYYTNEWSYIFTGNGVEGATRAGERATVWGTSTKQRTQNGPNTITFDRPVRQVTVQIAMIDVPGHRMEAYDANGVEVGEAVFATGGGVEDARTIDAPGIVKVLVYAAPTGYVTFGDTAVDYVSYAVGFVPDSACPPIDPALDDPAVRAGLGAEFAASVSEGLERAGWVYRNVTTGERRVIFIPTGGRTPCDSYTFVEPPTYEPVGEETGWVGETPWHTHPVNSGAFVPASCGREPNARARAGPSPEDRAAIGAIAVARPAARILIVDRTLYHVVQRDGRSQPHARNPRDCKW